MAGVHATLLGSRPEAATADRAAHNGTRRRLVTLAVLALTAVTLYAHRGDLPSAWRTLRHARMAWFVLGLALAALGLVDIAAEHVTSRRAVALDSRFRSVLPLALAARFLNLVAKSGGLAGVTVFRSAARRSGDSQGKVTAAYMLVAVLDPLAFTLVLAAAATVLVVEGRFSLAYGAAIVVFAGYLAVNLVAVVVAFRSRTAVRALFQMPGRVARRLRRRGTPALPPDHARADEFYDAVAVLRHRMRSLWAPALAALGLRMLGVAELWAVLTALRISAGWTMALVAYAVATLFSIVGVVPGGIGFVEVSLGAVLVSFGVAVGVAGAAVVVYRVVDYWFPLAVGALAAHRVIKRPVAA